MAATNAGDPIGAGICPAAQELIEFAAGESSEEALASISNHLEACETCQQALARLQMHPGSLVQQLRHALQLPVGSDDDACLRLVESASRFRTQFEPLGRNNGATLATGARVSYEEQSESSALDTVTLPALPATISRFHVLSLLGEGNFGRVFLVHDPRLDRQIALKVIQPARALGTDLPRDLLKEARTAARLKHPGIVTIHEVACDADGLPYVAMEYVSGGSLKTLISDGPQPAAKVASLIGQAAEAVHSAHKAGLVHRDLKPANVLLEPDGSVKLADFGLALHEDQQRTHVGDLSGTAAYMSPEQVRGEAHHLDGRTDIWSLGVIMYELLTGRRPFSGSRQQLADEILHRPCKPPRQIRDDIDPALEQICLTCLAKEPQQRYASAKDLAGALDGWKRRTLPAKWKPRRSATAIAAIAAAVFLLAAVAWRKWLSEPEIPYQVDRAATPTVWLPLMTQPPEDLLPGGFGVNWSYRAKEQEIQVDSRTIDLLGLGETRSDWFQLQVEIFKDRLEGQAGIFLGHRPLPPQNGRLRWECQLVTVRKMEEGDLLLIELNKLVIEESAGKFFAASRYKLATARVPLEALQPAVLDVGVHGDRIRSVLWQNRPLRELKDDKPDDSGRVLGCRGRFGLVNERGNTVFSDARFKSLRSDKP